MGLGWTKIPSRPDLSPVFADYARAYDWLYEDKDYEAECDFVLDLARRYGAAPIRSILDLGCGTGGHLLPLAARGFRVVGVDLSLNMLKAANQKLRPGVDAQLLQGDVRNVRLRSDFDVVLLMFAVLGYQITNQAVIDTLDTARLHLGDGGLLIFDVWFGPTVLREGAVERVKELARGDDRLIRIARPRQDLIAQTVDVEYQLLELRGGQLLREVRESHVMRFFFAQELALLLEAANLQLVGMCPFLQAGSTIGEHDWNVTVVASR